MLFGVIRVVAMVDLPKKFIPAFLMVVLFLSSCNENYHLRRSLIAFEAETIELPQKLLKVENGSSEMISMHLDGKTIVVYFAPGECTTCALTHLEPVKSLFDTLRHAPSVNIVILFVPVEGDFRDMVSMIENMNYGFPIYVDFERRFISNPIPEDARFHSFMLNEENHPIVVGNPISSERIRKLMIEQVF